VICTNVMTKYMIPDIMSSNLNERATKPDVNLAPAET